MRSLMMAGGSLHSRRTPSRLKIRILGGATLALALAGATGAQAQCTSTGNPLFNSLANGGVSAVNSLVAATNTVNTAFLTQTSAFIGSPQTNIADQTVGGAWSRGIAGEVDMKATGTATGTGSLALGRIVLNGVGNVTCNTTTQVGYGGYQVGQDLARINIGGGGTNAYFGVTTGYVGANAKDVTTGIDNPAPGINTHDFGSTFQVPFVGVYGAIVHGGFYVDGQVLANFYQMQLGSLSNGLFDQALNGHGIAATGNVGYHHDLGNNWFVEPSAGVTWSRVSVDPLSVSGTLVLANNPGLSPPGTFQVNDINSILGRIGVRVGTSATFGNLYLQPFATAALWHEFASDVTSTFTGFPINAFGLNVNGNAAFTTSRVGTYGQFGAGIAGSFIGTGWLGYARVDVREGENIQAVGVNLGLRYQFDPVPVTPVGIFKAKAPVLPPIVAYNWTGFYVGGFVSSGLGHQEWTFLPGGTPFSNKVAGFLGGADLGFNYQVGSFVFGVEADVGLGSLFGGVSCPNLFFFTCKDTVRYVASATGRVGYAWDRTLFYVKGGAAWTKNDFDASCNTDSQPGIAGFNFGPGGIVCDGSHDTATDHRSGWTVGGGIEYGLLPNWSVKAEYDHYDFGTKSVTLTDLIPLQVKETIDIVKIGLNYRFTFAPPAIVTKY